MRQVLSCALLVFLSPAVPAFAATFTVTTNADAGAGSLRAAIIAANANAGLDVIEFEIGAGGAQVIEVATALPDITDAVIVDGTTQPGFAGRPIVTIDGRGVAIHGNGLTIAATSPSTIRGLVITDFGESGIQIEKGGATIVGNYIGVDASGSAAKANVDGIRVLNDVDGNVIGGPAPADRNVISGNRSAGIFFWAITGGTSDNNVIQGNIIGLDATGTSALGNLIGIRFSGGSGNRIGGTAPGEGNVISGNEWDGIDIGIGFTETTAFAAADNEVQGNFVGTNLTGTAMIPNGTNGITVSGATRTMVGGAAPSARNIVSGNGWHGVAMITSCSGNLATCMPSHDTVVEGNFIGTDASGTQDFGNMRYGVLVAGARGTTIRGNVVSANEIEGILMAAVSGFDEVYRPLDTVIVSNLIGTNAAGTAALPNESAGIALFSSDKTTIGGAGAENIIRFNHGPGISVRSGSGNQIVRNSIDLNGSIGIDLAADGVTPNDVLDADAGANNLQNYPILTAATVSASTNVRGTLNSTPLRTFRIEFFSSPAADPTGFGEGRTFIGSVDVRTDAAGDASIAATLPAVATGSVITSTATDLTALDTSEFSNGVTAAAAPLLNVSDVEVVEGDSGVRAANFLVSLTAPAAVDVEFQYATADRTAIAPGDYTPASGTGLIPAGSSSTSIAVDVRGDTIAEGNETFVVNVTAVTGATARDAQGEATITNDDAATAASIPTASEWALIAMALLIACAGVTVIRR